MSQIERAVDIVRSALGDDLLGSYLYGSSVVGGLKPRSDLDILVVSRRPTTDAEKRSLVAALMRISGRRAVSGPARSLEVTVVVHSDVRPWRYPPRLDFQYGDWFRPDYAAGVVAPWASPNPDVALLLTTVLLANRTLAGPPAEDLLDPVPRPDLERAMTDGIPDLLADLESDTANVMLTLARIWTTLATGEIRPKDRAADWVLARLPPEHHAVLARSRDVYLGVVDDTWDDLRRAISADAAALITAIRRVAARDWVPDTKKAAARQPEPPP